MDVSFDFYFSASDAIKGEGLQEGVDWLQGTSHATATVHCASVACFFSFHFIFIFYFYYINASLFFISAVRKNNTVSI